MATGVRVRQLSRAFGSQQVLRGLDLDIAPGAYVALLGRSGSGKSTLLRVLARLDRRPEDRVDLPARIAVSFQEARLLPWRRVLGNVTYGLRGPNARERARTALAEVGLAAKEDAWPLTLSGGEAQRASLARALVREPDLLLLDEPFGALDALTRLTMHDLVLNLWRRHRPGVLMVTHDVDEAIKLAQRIVVLDRGVIVGDMDVADHPDPAALRRHLLDLLQVG